MKHYYYMGKPIRAVHYKMLSESNPPFKNTLFIQDDKDVRRGTCSICGCTMTDPCMSPEYGTCSWADDEETVCSWCVGWVLNKSERKHVIHRYNTNAKLMFVDEKSREIDNNYGEGCNVSLKSSSITVKSAADGEPMRFDNFGISFCCSGHISSEINLSSQTVGVGDFELIFPGSIYRLKEISGDCELIGIAISPFLLDGILQDADKTFFSRVRTNIRVRLEEDEQLLFKRMAEVYLQALQLYGETSNICREMTVCIVQFALQVCSSGRVSKIESNSRADELCGRFVSLLSQTKGTRRTIGWFAEELCVSNHYLSMAVKQSSGQSVKSIIDNAVIMEIKVLLRHSDLSVSQIADRLEFPNSSFMCKFFKAKTGITPLHYRSGR